MNQVSMVPFGTSTTVLNGYAQQGNDRLGNIDFIFENVGDKAVTIVVKELNAAGTAYTTTVLTTASLVAGGGTATYSIVTNSKRLGFFTSAGGGTAVNITPVIRNKANLRGASIDIVAPGKKGWGFDVAYDHATTQKKWGTPPDKPLNAESDGWGGSTPANDADTGDADIE